MIVDLNFKLISFFLDFAHCLVCKLQLVCQVINVSLQRFDFRDVVLLLLLELFDEEGASTCILLHVKAFLVKLVVLIGDLFDSFLMPFVFNT